RFRSAHMPRPPGRFSAIVLFGLLFPTNANAADPPAKDDKGRPRLVVQLGHTNWIGSVAFSPNGKTFLTARGDATAALWDVDTGKELRRFEGHAGFVHSAAFSRDGKRVVTGGEDKSARIWDTGTGKELLRLEGHTGAVCAVAFAPDGKRVL